MAGHEDLRTLRLLDLAPYDTIVVRWRVRARCGISPRGVAPAAQGAIDNARLRSSISLPMQPVRTRLWLQDRFER
jgi:hypothetical protein